MGLDNIHDIREKLVGHDLNALGEVNDRINRLLEQSTDEQRHQELLDFQQEVSDAIDYIITNR